MSIFKKRIVPDPDKQKLINPDPAEKFFTVKKISHALGCSKESFCRVCKEYGIKIEKIENIDSISLKQLQKLVLKFPQPTEIFLGENYISNKIS